MKLKRVASVCNQTGGYYLFDKVDEQDAENITQWLGDGYAAYPIMGLPYLELENICAMFDISEKRQEKLIMKHTGAPTELCLEDTESGEVQVKDPILRVVFRGRELVPLKTEEGIVFIREKYLTPLDDDMEYMRLFVRKSKSGAQYVVAKVGFMIQAVILAVENVLDVEFLEALDDLNAQCVRTLAAKALRERREKDAMAKVDDTTGEVLDFPWSIKPEEEEGEKNNV